MKKFLIAAVVAASALGATLPSQAAGEVLHDTKFYDFSSIAVSLTGAANIGGVTFGAPGLYPTKVVVRDDLEMNVSLIVGQDFNANSIVGEAGEPEAIGCGTVDLASSKVNWDPNRPISVFVQTADVACAGELGTSGNVDLYAFLP